MRILVWGGIMLMGFLTLLITMFFTHGQSLLDLTYCRTGDTYYDFTISIVGARSRSEYGGMYPPLAQLFFYVIAWMLPPAYDEMTIRELIAQPLGALYVLFFFVAITVWIYWLLEDNLNAPKWVRRICLVLLFFSAPFIYGVQRGNVLFLCLPLVLFYVFYYDSERPFMRGAAMVCLAIAAGIKLYPAILGLMLVRERRWMQTWVCLIIGVVLAILPAFFFDGVNTLIIVAQRIFATSTAYDNRGVGHQVSFQNTIEIINQAFGSTLNEDFLFVLMIIFMLVTFFLTKQRWQQLTMLCAAMVIWPSLSFVYTMVFMMVPLVVYLNSTEKFTWLDVIYCILFAACFVVIPFGGKNAFAFTAEQYYDLNITTVVENIGVNLLVLIIGVQAICDSIGTRIKRKNAG